MTKQQKLTKLIEIAVENGYKIEKYHDCDLWGGLWVDYQFINSEDDPDLMEVHKSVNDILFSKPFAKAIWENGHIWYYLCGHGTEEFAEGDDDWTKAGNCLECMKTNSGGASIVHYAWKYHLQEAVISDDPLGYYWDNHDKPKS